MVGNKYNTPTEIFCCDEKIQPTNTPHYPPSGQVWWWQVQLLKLVKELLYHINFYSPTIQTNQIHMGGSQNPQQYVSSSQVSIRTKTSSWAEINIVTISSLRDNSISYQLIRQKSNLIFLSVKIHCRTRSSLDTTSR